MISKNNPKSVLLNIDGIDIKVVLKWEGYELFVDNQLVDEWKGMGISIPLIQVTRLNAKPKSGMYIEANIRNMGIGFRLEVRSNGKLVHSQFFA